MLTLIQIQRDTPEEDEQLLVFGVGDPTIIPAIEEVRDEEAAITVPAQPEQRFFKKLRNHLLRNTSSKLSDTQLELLAREEMGE